ncbi:hypothetical protein LCGC14_2022530 [marine sediment metagenome]|uniref:Urease accessory protein UreH-like transmembrane domain-containing protein n=1 Tax=marine sediment metagenome TaxID=412755 RepID=A0A0F9EX38_9ZZZZ|nr:sulfite exporter TauE/SafE family protein [Bacteroides sp.]
MGSFHCAGMCGPIAIALRLHGNRLPQKIYAGVLYNLGRTLTYGVMGAVFGLLGQGVKMIGFQQKVSIIMGAIMILSVFFPSLFKNQYRLDKSWTSLVGKLKSSIARMFAVLGTLYMLMFGLGTIPMMLAIAIAGNILSAAARRKINKLLPFLFVIVGVFFIMRGLSLGIPFLSPPSLETNMLFLIRMI